MPLAAQYFPSPPDWRNLTLYMIFTDRFADGNPANNELTPGVRAEPANPRGVHGGAASTPQQKTPFTPGSRPYPKPVEPPGPPKTGRASRAERPRALAAAGAPT